MNTIQRVFLIDDDEINNFICVNIMKKINFCEQIRAFESATESLGVLKKLVEEQSPEIPDVIFLDINMPIMNGWDFLNEFKTLKQKINKPVSLFMLSSSIYQADVEKSKEFEEVTDFVTKPLKESSLNDLKIKYFS